MILWYLGHAGVRIETDDQGQLYIDPYQLASGPKADWLLITHNHFDHRDEPSITPIRTEKTVVLTSDSNADQMDGIGLPPDDPEKREWTDGRIHVLAVEAYNTEKNYHSQGFGIGLVITLPKKDGTRVRIYHAGDTDHIPEMADLTKLHLDLALLPIGGTYTMDQREAVLAAQTIKAKLTIPIHYNTPGLDIAADPELFIKDLAQHGLNGQILKSGASLEL